MRREISVHGLNNIEQIIDAAINDLNWQTDSFDIKIILMEAFTNAYIHGNQRDISKPIFFRYCLQGDKVLFEVQDCGDNQNEVNIPTELSEERIFDESGRGLFIIQALADHVWFQNNTLMIEKRYCPSEI